MKRRTFLGTGLALAACTTGCLGQAGSTNPTTTTTTNDTTETGTPPTTEDKKPPCEPTTTTERKPTNPPELNRTPYPAAFQWNPANWPLSKTRAAKVVLCTTDDWKAQVYESALSPETRTFLGDTDYSDESVVALQIRLGAGMNRVILHSVDGIGTDTIDITVGEWESGSPINNAPTHLLLVRVENNGTEPTSANVTLKSGGTVSTEE